MRLTTVIASVNNNPEYYMFLPKQILFWGYFHIRFILIFVGEKIPDELLNYKDNIILWNKNLDINTTFIAQNIRMYYPSLIDNLMEDELIMMTDMDMLPINDKFFVEGLDNFSKNDFIYYCNVFNSSENNGYEPQTYMCYNAAHPHTWSKVFHIFGVDDIEKRLYDTYNSSYTGIPGIDPHWCIDQQILYNYCNNYESFKVLNRPLKRIETWDIYNNNIHSNNIHLYTDAHFHRSYFKNQHLIHYVEQLLFR